MWSIDNHTEFQTSGSWLIDQAGREVWAVAIKATLDVAANGLLTLAAEQAPVVELPEARGDAATASLRYDTELTLPRGGTDIILDAEAHAPRGRAALQVPVAIQFGKLRKELIVHGPRIWSRGVTGLNPSAPDPFETMPIIYEHALGGTLLSDSGECLAMSADNPVGVGGGALKRAGAAAPAITYPGEEDNPKRVAGFAPLAQHWSPRREKYGTADDAWLRTRAPLMPKDYQSEAERCAPEDQQVAGYLDKVLAVWLVNLSPEGLLTFEVPAPKLEVTVRVARDKQVAHAKLVLITIVPHARQVSLVWQHWTVATAGMDSIGLTSIASVHA